MNHSGWFEEHEAPLRKGEEEETFFSVATNELNFASGVCFLAARFAPLIASEFSENHHMFRGVWL